MHLYNYKLYMLLYRKNSCIIITISLHSTCSVKVQTWAQVSGLLLHSSCEAYLTSQASTGNWPPQSISHSLAVHYMTNHRIIYIYIQQPDKIICGRCTIDLVWRSHTHTHKALCGCGYARLPLTFSQVIFYTPFPNIPVLRKKMIRKITLLISRA